jgi:hypothetical protein
MSKLRPDDALMLPATRLSELMTEWLQSTDPATIWQNCTTCHNLVEDKCKLFNAVPPPRVAVVGCPKYRDVVKPPFDGMDDDIPF